MENLPLKISRTAREKQNAAIKARNVEQLKDAMLNKSHPATLLIKRNDFFVLLEAERLGAIVFADSPPPSIDEESEDPRRIKVFLGENFDETWKNALATPSDDEDLKKSA